MGEYKREGLTECVERSENDSAQTPTRASICHITFLQSVAMTADPRLLRKATIPQHKTRTILPTLRAAKSDNE